MTAVPSPDAVDRPVSLTNRAVTGAMPTCLTAVSSAHVPEATVEKWTPSVLTPTANSPIDPAGPVPWRGS